MKVRQTISPYCNSYFLMSVGKEAVVWDSHRLYRTCLLRLIQRKQSEIQGYDLEGKARLQETKELEPQRPQTT